MNLSQAKAPDQITTSKPDFTISAFLQEVQALLSVSGLAQEFGEYLQKLSFRLPYSTPPGDKVIAALFKRIQTKKEKRTSKNWKKKWVFDEKELLVVVAFYYLRVAHKSEVELLDKSDWRSIASLIEKDHVETVFKFHSLMASNTQTEAWSEEEDHLLYTIVRKEMAESPQRIKWISIAKDFYRSSDQNAIFRNEKTCREHWINNLDPSINRASWTDEEDVALIKEWMSNIGKWSLIAQKLSGRNCYTVKNRFESLCRKFNVKKDCRNLLEEVERVYAMMHEERRKKQECEREKAIEAQKLGQMPQAQPNACGLNPNYMMVSPYVMGQMPVPVMTVFLSPVNAVPRNNGFLFM